MLGRVELDNTLLTCDQGNFNQIATWSRDRTLITVVRDTCTTTVPHQHPSVPKIGNVFFFLTHSKHWWPKLFLFPRRRKVAANYGWKKTKNIVVQCYLVGDLTANICFFTPPPHFLAKIKMYLQCLILNRFTVQKDARDCNSFYSPYKTFPR